MKTLFNKLRKVIDWTTIKFLIVGVINTVVGTSVMFIAYNLVHLSYWISSASNYVVGSIVSYILNKTFTFQSNGNTSRSIVRFVINISFCYLVAYGLARPLARMVFSSLPVNIVENIAMLGGMCLFVVLNYFGQRYFVFKKDDLKED